MGRKPSAHTNLPQNMRARKQRSGKVYYYYDSGGRPRKEIPLGSDFILAIKKYAELHINAGDVSGRVLFPDVAKRYQVEEITKKARSTQSVQLSDIKHLLAFFGDPPAPLESIEPTHLRMFLTKLKDKPTTANRCKRLFSHMWNMAREWGYTKLPNPADGIKGHTLDKREVYVGDDLYRLVYEQGSRPLRDAMDLIYLTGQRPGDVFNMAATDIWDGHLVIKQSKTKAPLRIAVIGEFSALLDRIAERKEEIGSASDYLLVGDGGRKLTQAALRWHFQKAKEAAAKAHKDRKDAIENFWLYDLRAKAADDTSDKKGDAAAADLLGHADVRTTKRHYLRRGKRVAPTK